MLPEGFFTYSRGAYTNFLHEERKMCRLFFTAVRTLRAVWTSLRSGANVPTRIKSLFRTWIENNYSQLRHEIGPLIFHV